MGHLDKIISHLYIYIYEKSVNSDDKQFHQYQQYEQLTITSNS